MIIKYNAKRTAREKSYWAQCVPRVKPEHKRQDLKECLERLFAELVGNQRHPIKAAEAALALYNLLYFTHRPSLELVEYKPPLLVRHLARRYRVERNWPTRLDKEQAEREEGKLRTPKTDRNLSKAEREGWGYWFDEDADDVAHDIITGILIAGKNGGKMPKAKQPIREFSRWVWGFIKNTAVEFLKTRTDHPLVTPWHWDVPEREMLYDAIRAIIQRYNASGAFTDYYYPVDCGHEHPEYLLGLTFHAGHGSGHTIDYLNNPFVEGLVLQTFEAQDEATLKDNADFCAASRIYYGDDTTSVGGRFMYAEFRRPSRFESQPITHAVAA